MRCLSRTAIVAALCCLSSHLDAQRVTGYVRESRTSAPIAGAVVSLLDSTGKLLTRTVSSVDGQYRLTTSGRVAKVTAIRIGFRPAVQPISRRAAGTDITADITMEALPTLLGAVAVHDESLCPASADGPTAFALWEQVRTALLESVVAREANPAKVRMVSYLRHIAVPEAKVDHQAVRDSSYVASQAVVSARTARQFAEHGFRDLNEDGVLQTHYAPDAEVLIDSTFLLGHCLSMRTDANGHANEVGIAFAPVKDRGSIVDISGVLWLDRAAAALRSLDFRYTNVGAVESRAGVGGSLVFTEMPDGVPMITRWNLHTTILLQLRPGVDASPVGPAPGSVVGFHDIGGEVARAAWRDGTFWVGDLATVSGIVNLESGVPATDAEVRFVDSDITTRTDSAGRFTFPTIVPGPYTVQAFDGIMGNVGVALTSSTKLEAERGKKYDVHVVLPSRQTSIDAFCRNAPRPSPDNPNDAQMVTGNVVQANGASASQASVVAAWMRRNGDGQRPVTFTVQTDAKGVFSMCGMPLNAPLTFTASLRDSRSAKWTIVIDSLELAGRVKLPLTGERPQASVP